MKHIFLLLAVALCGCSAYYAIGGQSATALQQDYQLQRDVHTLTGLKRSDPQSPYNPILYAQINADILNCQTAYRAILHDSLSLSQLQHVQTIVNLYRVHDSLGMAPDFARDNGVLLDTAIAQLPSLELYKLHQ